MRRLPSVRPCAGDGRPDDSTAYTNYTAGTENAVDCGRVPAGLVSSQVTFAGAVTTYRYYANGDLAEVTSPSRLVTKYTHDGLGRKVTEKQVSDSFPAGVITSYGYDQASHVVTETGSGVKNEATAGGRIYPRWGLHGSSSVARKIFISSWANQGGAV
ncbi:hypothetical protein [Streptomyces sp. NPDC004680]|uniref:hypothetical protein n=1 Tax=Streptomyces sp. NPDC004680 TaxID=3154287 RepID=UPI0033AF6569